jgi:hypothetical protein
MTSRISHTSFDARNAYAQSVFWSRVLDFVEDPDDPNEPGHAECLITSRDRSQLLLFITVPDGKWWEGTPSHSVPPRCSIRSRRTSA